MAQFLYLFIVLVYTSRVFGEKCVKYSFESGFESFSKDIGVCIGAQSWVQQNYSSISIDSPNSNSEVFIKPNKDFSCVSSFLFPIEANGVIEVNIYMETTSVLDQIIIFVNEYVPSGNDIAISVISQSSLDSTFVPGWQTLRAVVVGTGSYTGYVSFLGIASEESIVLVDSFRYIPPGYLEENCLIYEEIEITSAKPDLTTTSVVQLEVPEEICIVYDFETNFDNLFNNKGELCGGFSTWNLGNYSSLQIQSPHIDSDVFITPNEEISCVASFLFPMEVSGIVEVNIYMESTLPSDQISMFVMENVLNSNDLVTGTATLTPLNTNFVVGWNVLRLSVTGAGSYNGYITIIGTANENSTVLIDSFRYIPPSYDEKSCHIYEELETESEPPPSSKPAIEDCVTYYIKDDFDEVFDKSKSVCTGYLPWNLSRYDNAVIDSPTSNSELYIAATEYSNCISSFSFPMSPAGRLEVTVFMDSADSRIDNVIVLAKKVVDNGFDTVNGFVLHTPSNDDYVEGWQVINVTLNDFGSFDGYVTFVGTAAVGSTVLIDSFRYIPPFADEDSCSY